MAIEGRRAGRMIAAWAKAFDLSEPELQLLWCLRQELGDGVDQTTISTRLAFSPAQVSAMVERLRAHGLIIQRLTVGDRRRRAVAALGRWAGGCGAIVGACRRGESLSRKRRERDGAGGGGRGVAGGDGLSLRLHAGLLPQAGRRRSELHHRSQVGSGRLGAGRISHRRRSALADVRPGRSRLSADAAGRSDLAPADGLRRLQAGRALLAARAAHAVRRQSELGGIPAAERRGAGRARPAGCGADGAAAVDRLPAATRNAVPVEPRRDVRAVPLRHAVLRRVVDLFHGRWAGTGRAPGFGSSELEVSPLRRAIGCERRS